MLRQTNHDAAPLAVSLGVVGHVPQAVERSQLLRDPSVIDSPCSRTVLVNNREVICLSSNDYLSLGNSPELTEATVAAIRRWGVGAGASRLVCGTQGPHVELEQRISKFKCTESAVVTATGWMANHAAIRAFVSKLLETGGN